MISRSSEQLVTSTLSASSLSSDNSGSIASDEGKGEIKALAKREESITWLNNLTEFLALLEKPSTDGLSSAYPSGLHLDLNYNRIGEAETAKLADALSSGRCPSGLQLHLSDNEIGETEAAKLAAALSSGRCPSGLQLYLGGNEIGEVGAAKLAEALSSGRCSSGLQLDLGSNEIGEVGATKLAAALSSGRCPSRLHLDLFHNGIGETGAAKLAEALSSGRCPSGLQLSLSDNGIGEAGAAKLAEALSSGRCPGGFQLNLDDNGIGRTTLNQINKLLDANEKRHAVLPCVAFYQGIRSPLTPVRNLPSAIADHICSFLVPAATSKNRSLFFAQIQRAAFPVRLVPTGGASGVPAKAETKTQAKSQRLN